MSTTVNASAAVASDRLDGPCGAFVHEALIYHDAHEFSLATTAFIRDGLARGERALVAVPGAKIGPMRSALGAVDGVEFFDMTVLGRNPNRVIPAVRSWVDARSQGGRCRFIGEPIWPGRSSREIVEATRHEALMNLAFADAAVTIMCPYDGAGLHPAVVAAASWTHPMLASARRRWPSSRYREPLAIWRGREWSLPPAPPRAAVMTVTDDLAALRRFTAAHAVRAGLDERRTGDLVLAVDEAATNALLYGHAPRELRTWRGDTRVTCELSSIGALADPLSGRQRPAPHSGGGRGLWLINQLCDLVELHSDAGATTIRLHVDAER